MNQKILLLLLLPAYFFIIFAMEQPVIFAPFNGNLCLQGHTPVYAGYDHNDPMLSEIEEAFGFKIKPNDPLIQVFVSGEKCQNWHSHPHKLFGPIEIIQDHVNNPSFKYKKFPEYLPLSIIHNIKENEKFELTVYGKKVILIAQQMNSRFNGLGTFNEAVALSINAFFLNPNYVSKDEQQLVRNGIIRILENGKKVHGPNSFFSYQ